MTYPFADDVKRITKAFKEKHPDEDIYGIGWEYSKQLIFPKTIYTKDCGRFSATTLEHAGEERPNESSIERYEHGKMVKNYIIDRRSAGAIPDGVNKSWITVDKDNKVVGYIYRIFRPDLFIGYMVNKEMPPKVVLLFDDLRQQVKSAKYGFQIKDGGRYGLYVAFHEEGWM